MNPGEIETYRAVLHARRPVDVGGEACTLIVRRVNGRIELLHHGVLSTGAMLTDDQADELARRLTAARQKQP
ncbi:MAG: hypothetical protein GEU83_14875 [Pseudonocardiaceae bacterium]|nr:hypothetical protein [Pseudonocardiaceae bacterium]